MAKRPAKSPASTPDAPARTFQIPEANPAASSPWETIAASVPKLPGARDVTASAPPVAKVKPTLPTGIHDFDPEEVQRAKAGLLDASVTIARPALSRMNFMGTELLGTCATANELGTLQPIKALVTESDDRRWFFLMPVGHEADKAVEIDYRRKLACINLWKPFARFGRSIERGYTESFALGMTEEPISIHGVKGYALYFDLTNPDKQPIQERTETPVERTATGKTKQGRTAKQSAPTASASAGASAGASTAAADPADAAETIRQLRVELDKRDSQLDDRDAQIDEFEQRLQAYIEKYGRL